MKRLAILQYRKILADPAWLRLEIQVGSAAEAGQLSQTIERVFSVAGGVLLPGSGMMLSSICSSIRRQR